MERGVDPGLKGTLTWIAVVVAAATAVAIPALYLYTAYSYESDRIQRRTDTLARTVSEFVITYPDIWFFNEHLQQKVLLEQQARAHHDVLRLIDRDGRLIIETGTLPAAPTVVRMSDFSDGFDVVGRVEIVESLRHVWLRTGIAAIVGAVLALAMFAALRVLPLRALTHALGRLQASRTQLVATQDELLRKTRLAVLGQLSATVSHELRNPLGTIRTSMITITDNTEGRGLDVEGAIARIERNVKRCDDIIGELLDYTRDTAPNREPTDVDEWLGGVLDEQEVPTGLSIGRDLASGVEADIDRDQVRRAVINIYDNACQAVKDNGAGADKEIVVATKVNGERVEIVVRDSGPGIPDDELGKIFEPLYSTKSFGVGLGLPVVKKIAEEHGGGIDIASGIGHGTRVTLWLPLTAPEQGGNETS